MPIIYRLEPLRGYNPIDIHRYKEYIQFISDRDEPVPPGNGIPNFPMVNKSLLDCSRCAISCSPVICRRWRGSRPTSPRIRAGRRSPTILRPRLTCSSPGGRQQLPPFTVYENRDAFPQAFVVPRAEPLPERSRVLSALKQADLRQVVFLEDFEPPGGLPDSSGRFRRATISTYEPNHVVVEVDCDSPGYLVLSDPWYPGWSCTLDEHPTRLYRANYAFRAAAVPAGKHTVRFDFDPISYRRGRVISEASLAAVAVLGLATILRRRHRRPENALPVEPVTTRRIAHSEMTE